MNALVTGGTRGIGEAVVRALCAQGINTVFFFKKNTEKAKEIEKQTGARGFQCDVSDIKAVRASLSAAFSDGQVDILVNNAGVSVVKPFDACKEDEISSLYGTNLFGTLNCSRAVSEMMIRQKNGVIVNVSSIWGVHGASCEVDYSVTKGGVLTFTKALAKELGPSGIRVNCVCPGFIDTEMNGALSDKDREDFLSSLALGRAGTADEVAKAIMFLISDSASYITGACLNIDGGY